MALSPTRLVAVAALIMFASGVLAANPPRVRVGGDLKPPQKLVHVNPIYPEEAKANNITGMVILEAIIATDGTVTDLKVLRSAHPLLDDAASEAVRQWVYASTLVNGEPVELIMSINVTFAKKDGTV